MTKYRCCVFVCVFVRTAWFQVRTCRYASISPDWWMLVSCGSYSKCQQGCFVDDQLLRWCLFRLVSLSLVLTHNYKWMNDTDRFLFSLKRCVEVDLVRKKKWTVLRMINMSFSERVETFSFFFFSGLKLILIMCHPHPHPHPHPHVCGWGRITWKKYNGGFLWKERRWSIEWKNLISSSCHDVKEWKQTIFGDVSQWTRIDLSSISVCFLDQWAVRQGLRLGQLKFFFLLVASDLSRRSSSPMCPLSSHYQRVNSRSKCCSPDLLFFSSFSFWFCVEFVHSFMHDSCIEQFTSVD